MNHDWENRTLDIKTRRRMIAILRVLHEAPGPLGSQRIAETLHYNGVDIGERSVRNYLAEADELGWTENLGRRGRRLTERGSRELDGALVVDKVGFVSARVDTLAYQMSFDPTIKQGDIILNVSTVSARDVRPAIDALVRIFEAGLGMGRRVAFCAPDSAIPPCPATAAPSATAAASVSTACCSMATWRPRRASAACSNSNTATPAASRRSSTTTAPRSTRSRSSSAGT